jgi:ferredoxin
VCTETFYYTGCGLYGSWGECINICPVNAIINEEDPSFRVDPNLCTGCGACADACPVEAINPC